MNTKLFLLIISIVNLSCLQNIINAQDNCNDILEQGLFDKLDLERYNTFEESFDKYIETSRFNEYASNNEFGFNVGIPLKLGKFGFGVDADDMTVSKFQNLYKNEVNESKKAVIREYLKTEIASKVITDAWSNCMKDGNKIGLVYNLEYNENSPIVILRAKWVARMNVNEAVISNDIVVINGKNMNNGLKKGTKLGTEWVSCIIERDDLKSDLVMEIPLDNNLGSTIIKVDAKLVVKKSIPDLCFKESDMDACKELLSQNFSEVEKIQKENPAKKQECEKLVEPQKSTCFNKVTFELDNAFANHGILRQLVKKISDVKGTCTVAKNSQKCINDRRLLNADIFNFINKTPLQTNQQYKFEFVPQKN